jgi:hypothetical protein
VQHDLGFGLAPDQDADLLAGRDIDVLTADGRRLGLGQPSFGRVVGEQPELVVIFHALDSKGSPGRRAFPAVRPGGWMGA